MFPGRLGRNGEIGDSLISKRELWNAPRTCLDEEPSMRPAAASSIWV